MKKISQKVVRLLKRKKLRISLAESCTGGMLSSSITSINGSSKIFKAGFVTYSNESKIKILKISKSIIKKYGAVSIQVCKSMAKNACKIGNTSMAVSITGIAGPSGGTKRKPVGLVYIGVCKNDMTTVNKYIFKNKGRSYIQKATVKKCLELILNILK